jgi:hypothetical protein
MSPKEMGMEVLEAFDLTKSLRAAAQLTGWTTKPWPRR